MGQEAAPFIDTLNSSWPLSTDLIRYGAVHLRTIKGAVKATFPNLTGAVTLTQAQLNDAALKSVSNIFTSGLTTFQGVGSVDIRLTDTTAALDEKIWAIRNSIGRLEIFTVNDAGAGIANGFWLDRAAGVVTLAELLATLIRFTGAVHITGVLDLGHATDTTIARARAGVASIEGTELGWMNLPQNSQNGSYTCVLEDAGKHILHPSGAAAGQTYTIPANASVAYPIGSFIGFVNLSVNPVSIAVTTDSLLLEGVGTAGTRTLAQNGKAGAFKVGATTWLIGGSGLS